MSREAPEPGDWGHAEPGGREGVEPGDRGHAKPGGRAPDERHAARPVEGSPVEAVVAFGANLGDRYATLAAAAREITALQGVSGIRMSAPVESVALTLAGPDPDKPGYVNAVALVTTTLPPDALLAALHAVEDAHGRVREERWGDRTLDLDVIAYGDLRSDDPQLTLPHPRAHQRDFVLEPWLELDPEAVVPGRGRVAELLAELRAADAERDPHQSNPDQTDRHRSDRHSADRHSADRHSADRHSADRHSADRHSADQDRAGRHRVDQGATGHDRASDADAPAAHPGSAAS